MTHVAFGARVRPVRRDAPNLAVVADDHASDEDVFNAFWVTVAGAASEAITSVPLSHPDAQELRQFACRCRAAAGLPPLQDATLLPLPVAGTG